MKSLSSIFEKKIRPGDICTVRPEHCPNEANKKVKVLHKVGNDRVRVRPANYAEDIFSGKFADIPTKYLKKIIRAL